MPPSDDISISLLDDVDQSVVSDFLDAVEGAGFKVSVTRRTAEPSAAVEWLAAGAVLLVILSRKFFESFGAKIGDRLADDLYDSLKAKLVELTKRTSAPDRVIAVSKVAPSGSVPRPLPGLTIFVEVQLGVVVQFQFLPNTPAALFERAVDDLYHLVPQLSSMSSTQLQEARFASAGRPIYFFDSSSGRWTLWDSRNPAHRSLDKRKKP